MWKWGRKSDSSLELLPTISLRFPKLDEKPRFQTWNEIESRIKRGGLSVAEIADRWDCLFLDLTEIEVLLAHVRETARHPFIHPMIATAAYTGARRSELMRSQLEDVDFVTRMFTVREKKRVKSKRTARRVPMSAQLMEILERWMSQHPGGSNTFCLEPGICRSQSPRLQPSSITPDQSVDHFKRTLGNSRWSVVRGWHVFRHSFYSNCAAAGIDQRLINEWVGHQPEDMVRRYRHLFPKQQHVAIQQVFATV